MEAHKINSLIASGGCAPDPFFRDTLPNLAPPLLSESFGSTPVYLLVYRYRYQMIMKSVLKLCAYKTPPIKSGHIYIHTNIHTCIHACICTCIHTYIHTYIHACMHACIHTYIHTYIHAYIYTYILACITYKYQY